MPDSSEQHVPVRTVLLGMRCAATEPVLHRLLREPAVDLQAVVLPAAPPAAVDPVTEETRRNGIPIHALGHRAGLGDPAFRAAMEAIAPDLVVVACFPWRIPAWLRSLPTSGCVNIHPSLLPDGRGPEPVFWAFRWGLAETGVTLHHVDAGFDTGPIVAQEGFAIPDGATIDSLERSLADLGVRLLVDTLPALLDGTNTASRQAHGLARHAPVPGPADLIVPTSWSARHAARFIQAVASSHAPLVVLVQASGQRLAIHGIIDADDTATIPAPVMRDGPLIRLRFSPGVLTVRPHALPEPLRLQRPSVNRQDR